MNALTVGHRPNNNPRHDEDRRRAPDSRVGRRWTDAWFPYSTPFVAQALAQAEPPAAVQPVQGYGDSEGHADRGSAQSRRAITA